MKKHFLLAMFLNVALVPLVAQTVDSSVCEILANPRSFDGKTVRIKGVVIAGFDEFVVKDPSCKKTVNAIWLSYPEGTKAKAGPAAFLRLQLAKNSPATTLGAPRGALKLDKSEDFKHFDSFLSTPYKGKGMCLGCVKYTVTATLIGRIDGTESVGVSRDGDGKFNSVTGFGNMNQYRARLVLQSVSEVVSHEIDYSNAASAAKEDETGGAAGGDPVVAAHRAALAFGSGSPIGEQIERAAAAYGKPGEDNGVEIGFGVANEVPKGDGGKADGNSPDGLFLNCTFDMDRLKGDALSKAILHVGMHIADIRGTQSSMTLPQEEYRAWQTTTLGAIASHLKTLVLPGGYIVWNAAWAPNDRNKMVDQGIAGFLQNWSSFGN